IWLQQSSDYAAQSTGSIIFLLAIVLLAIGCSGPSRNRRIGHRRQRDHVRQHSGADRRADASSREGSDVIDVGSHERAARRKSTTPSIRRWLYWTLLAVCVGAIAVEWLTSGGDDLRILR